MDTEKHNASRRDFVKKAAYVAPAIATFAVTPSYAKNGSDKKEKDVTGLAPQSPTNPGLPTKLT
jgi:hypothetical protein